MNPARAALAAIILLLGAWANTSPEVLDDWLGNQAPISSEEPELVGLQEIEEWLVLRVEFPGRQFDQNKADAMFVSDGQASRYIDQMSGSESILKATISDRIWTSPNPESHWGYDSDEERDVSVDGLVEASCSDLLEGMDLTKWDFDGDGAVDRLLILHSGRAQESGAGSDALWSHMSWLIEPLQIGDWSVNHYTIASLDSGIGTVIHEMLHQMGAYDLYDVHSEIPSSNWNGLGDWDIMASGNWNDNGNTPALPGAATLDLIGANRYSELELLTNSTHLLEPVSEGGQGLAIPIAPGEKIWVTYRGNSGFDSDLPGHGILVEHSDENNGNPVENLVNTDPDNAWVRIIEADGDAALERGRDSGSSGDVFDSGESFGASGMKIRDNRGRLVEWTITVHDISNDSATVSITVDMSSNVVSLTPRSPVQLLPTESIFVEVTATMTCNLEIALRTHQSDNSPPEYIEIPEGTYDVQILSSEDAPSASFTLTGTIGCEEESKRDISLEVNIIGHRMSSEELFSVISWEKPSVISLTPNYEGDGEVTYSIALEGAASRIASAQTPATLSPGDPIVLDVDPMGLLEPAMLARGTIVLSDNHGHEHRIPLLLEAESPFTGDGWLAWFAEPSNGLLVISILLAISIVTGGRRE
ncbi:MAG: immune inhibitor A domain-containing protein [Candidatus Thermoplasmatota archaeon]|nr:immune inhibitor A domain-containing protein [Candidatus Thermoplasmatota archaeon]|tara:strand:+ start:5048 stop:6982 length:1935 start_codon:yes stop_codon:yes gene_type:complete